MLGIDGRNVFLCQGFVRRRLKVGVSESPIHPALPVLQDAVAAGTRALAADLMQRVGWPVTGIADAWRSHAVLVAVRSHGSRVRRQDLMEGYAYTCPATNEKAGARPAFFLLHHFCTKLARNALFLAIKWCPGEDSTAILRHCAVFGGNIPSSCFY